MRAHSPLRFPPPPETPVEELGRGDLVRLLYRLGRAHATGVVVIHADAEPEGILLRQGDVLGESVDPTGRQTEQRLARIASHARAACWFVGGTTCFPRHPLHPMLPVALWARRHLEAQMDANRARAMVQELAGVRLAIRAGQAPDRSLCDKTDMRILEVMRQPLRLDQIWPLARTPRFRLLAFLHFLRAVDALTLVGVAAPARAPRPDLATAHRLLGVGESADRETLKRAYRRLARALHPDLHPDASHDRRRELERKLAAVNSAYRELAAAL